MKSTIKTIEVKDLSFKAGEVSVLENISFSLNYGTITAIIGPNGAGKSTLVKIMLGLLNPTGGGVYYDGVTPGRVSGEMNLLGYVPQNFTFDRTFPMTVEEFFRLTCKMPDGGRFDEALSSLGLVKLKNRVMGALSGGEIQRLLIAYNLIHGHEIIFLDEPTSAIDIEGESMVYSIIRDLKEKFKKTVIIISHDIETVLKNVDTVICLNKTLHCIGCPHEIVTDTMIKQLFDGAKGLYRHGGCRHDA